MSGESAGRRTSEPLEFTDAEVKELAGRRAKPVAAATRLKRAVPADPAGRLTTDQAVPARVTRKELPSMRRAGRRPDKIMSRLTPSEAPAQQVDERKDQRHAVPTRKPPAVDS
jgi:hypothetical protein